MTDYVIHAGSRGACRRIVFVNRYYYPDVSATSQLLTDLARAMVDRGHAVHVIASRQCYDDPARRLPASEIVEGVIVHRVRTSRFGRDRLIGRAFDYISFYVSAVFALARLARKNDIVVLKTDPPLLSVVMGPVIRLKRARMVNWLQDLFPEVATALGVEKRWAAPFFAVLRAARNRSLRMAAKNVVLGDIMAERLKALRVADPLIQVIPNWSDDTSITQVVCAENSLRGEWSYTDDDFVVGYSGNLGRAHDIETIIGAMEELDQCGEAQAHIRFLFVGGGALYNKLQQETERRQLTNVQFKSYQPRERLAESLSVPDIHLVVLQAALEGLIVPSKFYGVAAVAKPLIFIGDPDGEIARIVRDHECGKTVEMGDAAGLIQAITALSQDKAQCTAMGARARRLLEKKFSAKAAIATWQKVFAGLRQQH